MWKSFLPHLLCLLQLKLCLSQRQCKWSVDLSKTQDPDGVLSNYIDQEEIPSVADFFMDLKDSPIDPNDKDARYYGFPYFLKISLVCTYQSGDLATRVGYYSGLNPILRVYFERPVNPMRQKVEQLQIEMLAAPFRLNDSTCDSEEVCKMFWFAPLPFMNGSVVNRVLVRTNGFGLPVLNRRLIINVNGFMAQSEKSEIFRIGEELKGLKGIFGLKDPSRPLWFTHRHAPVLILGGIPDKKIVLISNTNFDTFHPIEVAIDSCWIGSLSCPQAKFSSSIVDTIATESTLFIRQNQLVYYFTGHYSLLHLETKGSELWTRILNNVCVRKLLPVFFHHSNTEFVIALSGGSQEGEFFLISCKDGIVKASASLKEKRRTVCFQIFQQEHFEQLYEIPTRVPEASDKGFVMLLGTEEYTNKTLIPRGLAYNPFTRNFYVWGNVILVSYDMVNFIYLSNFPSASPIKDFVLSFSGPFAVMTESEELWVSKENGVEFKKVFPSDSWHKLSAFQRMSGSLRYSTTSEDAITSMYYDPTGLQTLIYVKDERGTEKFMKRNFPVDTVVAYDLLISTRNKKMTVDEKDYIRFTHLCPFATLHVLDVPQPQLYSRVEHYWATPPDVMEKSRFHEAKSLNVYQGLVYQLLQLHSSYHRPYADPVHDPTWRWWKNQKEEAEYFDYKARNWESLGGIFIDMLNYAKIYNLMANNHLATDLYLDKNTAYSFKVLMTIRTAKESMGETADENSLDYIWLAATMAHPQYVKAELQRQELISRGSVLYRVTIKDIGKYPRQQLSGRRLLKSSATLKVVHSDMACYRHGSLSPHLLGSKTFLIHIGCPPGKRLAFDITYTQNYTTEKNKHYFDCVEPDPEMPCFFFSDVFYPFFLIQDMVTGDSGRFQGSYLFTIIGGGPFSQSNIRYFTPEEIVKYNTNRGSNSSALIWARADVEVDDTNEEGFPVLSESNSGIVWICQKNSPCYDIVPQSLATPDYFFVIKVSNRGVDQTTYCDYALEFIVHIHGLRLSPHRAMYIMKISFAVIIGLVILYIFVDTVAPWVKRFCNRTLKRMEEAIAFRAESSLTFSSSFSSQGSLRHLPSDISSGDPANVPSTTQAHSKRFAPHHEAQ
ncbi:cation channel sperm-associated protein subunit gamma [Thamnophis elegans]|uniref:cation channel sperm-associated protein subunit gamma n=1 Tax=Thamnophis elegans TaxID=35005 RepID=UPI0013765B13|nr:cation channel sperm-associated protein subunit gamma [Thamnophis elegans]